MKQFLPIAFLATVLFVSLQSNATIRRVGYFGNATAIDYTDLQSAHDASAAGDSVYLYPGSWNFTMSKKLVIIGYGYYLTGSGANTGLQNITNPLSVTVYMTPGSDNSVFDGVDGLTINNYGSPGTTVSSIIIKHCYVSIIAYNGGNYPDYTGSDFVNWQVSQSYVGVNYNLRNGVGKLTNLKLNNCIVAGFGPIYNGSGSANTGQFNNCNFSNSPDLSGGGFIIKSCIFFGGVPYGDENCAYTSSLQNADQGISSNFNAGVNGNQSVSNNTSQFFITNNGSLSNDGVWILAAGSPAKGKGAGGTDCGIFGGTNPYVLSGLPAVPAFYKLTSSSNNTSTNPYIITFSVKSY